MVKKQKIIMLLLTFCIILNIFISGNYNHSKVRAETNDIITCQRRNVFDRIAGLKLTQSPV